MAIERLHESPSFEGLERRKRSNAFLASHRIPVNVYLPVLPAAADVNPRSKDEILERALALCVVALKGAGLERDRLQHFVQMSGADKYFSPAEQAFYRNWESSDQDNSTFSWRFEAMYVLLWSLGFVENLPVPREPNNMDAYILLFRENSLSQLRERARLRPSSEILDAADLAYRYHWAITEQRVNPKARRASISEDVVMEWHYALNWLIRYMDDEWDNISTDT